MKVFSLGFILIFSIIAIMLHIELKTLKEFFENMIVIIPSLIVLIFLSWLAITTIGNRCIHFVIYCAKKIYVFYKYIKNKFFRKTNEDQNKTKKLNWKCLLIDGTWGSGKTTYYKKHYQYIDNNPNIYISCFSASRSELIAQIIQQRFWCKLLTLNGLLAKLMESNWQMFMPKNRVMVFDDLERLHANQDNYLDLIGVIDYLKTTNKCKIILIADISKTPQIFNSYLERVVDEILDWQPCKINELLPENSTIFTKQLANYLTYHSGISFLENRRIIKNIQQQLNSWALKHDLFNNNKFYSSMILGYIKHNIRSLIKWHYIYFYDHEFFVNLANEAHNESMRHKLGQIKKLHPSEVCSKKEHDIVLHFSLDYKHSASQSIPPNIASSFGIHYLSTSTQDKCKKYSIHDDEIRFFTQIYQICANKDYQQLEREFYQRRGSGNGNLDTNNKISFKIGDILEYIIKTNINKQSEANAIFSLTSGLESLLSLVTNSNFERHDKFWFLPNNEYQNIFYLRQAQEFQNLVNSIMSRPEISEAIQQYKEYLRTKFQQVHSIEELQTEVLNNYDNSFIILGILYFVDSGVYKSIIERISKQIKQYVNNREAWLNEHIEISFNCDSNIVLWCFNGTNNDITTEVSQAYSTILNDVGLSNLTRK